MAFVGPIAGALAAGGIYYGFSNLIQTRTEQIRNDLHTLSNRLIESPARIPAPPPAISRITAHPWSSYFEARWNQEIAYLFTGFREWDRRATEWGRRVLYGGQTDENTGEQS